VSAEGQNFKAIAIAKADHERHCPAPPYAVRMHPFEIDRMDWEEGDVIAGLTLEADSSLGTGAFRLVCNSTDPAERKREEVLAATVDERLLPV
jgi:hypothetical protein